MLHWIGDGALRGAGRVRLHLDLGSFVETGEIDTIRPIDCCARVFLCVLALIDLIEWQTLYDVKSVSRLDERGTYLPRLECGHTVRERRNHRLLLVDAEAAARALATRIAAVLLRQLRKVGIGDCRQDRFGFLAHRILLRLCRGRWEAEQDVASRI